jgi:xanthine dehydrogenase molybdopterin-binding subunit B
MGRRRRRAVRFANGEVQAAASDAFAELVNQAYLARVQLWSDGFYATPGLSWDRQTLQGRPFYYFAYGAAVSEVLVDTLTGECEAAARRPAARRGPLAEPGASTSARSKAPSSRAWAG